MTCDEFKFLWRTRTDSPETLKRLFDHRSRCNDGCWKAKNGANEINCEQFDELIRNGVVLDEVPFIRCLEHIGHCKDHSDPKRMCCAEKIYHTPLQRRPRLLVMTQSYRDSGMVGLVPTGPVKAYASYIKDDTRDVINAAQDKFPEVSVVFNAKFEYGYDGHPSNGHRTCALIGDGYARVTDAMPVSMQSQGRERSPHRTLA